MKTKEEYIKQAKLKLDKLDAQIDLLEAEIAKKKVDATSAYYSRMAELKEKRSTALKKFKAIKDSSGDAWESLKEGFDNILDDVQTTYRNVKKAVTR